MLRMLRRIILRNQGPAVDALVKIGKRCKGVVKRVGQMSRFARLLICCSTTDEMLILNPTVFFLRRGVRLQSDLRAGEINRQFVVLQKVPAQYAALLESARFVYRVETQNQRAKIRLLKIGYPAGLYEQQFDII